MQGDHRSTDSLALPPIISKLCVQQLSIPKDDNYGYYNGFIKRIEDDGLDTNQVDSLYVNFGGTVNDSIRNDLGISVVEGHPHYNISYGKEIFNGYENTLGYYNMEEYYPMAHVINYSPNSYPLSYEYDEEQVVNPAHLEGSFSFQMDSGQTATFEQTNSVCEKIGSELKNKTRTQAMPTNVIATHKMDRKTLKRLRNRVSASRCRSKKKEWISDLENENTRLVEENSRLEIRILELEGQLRAKGYLIN